MFSTGLIKDQCYRQHRCSILWRKTEVPWLAHKCSLILIPPIRVQSVHVSPVHVQSCMLPVKTQMQERDFLLEQESWSDFLKEIKAGGRVAALKTMVEWDVAFWKLRRAQGVNVTVPKEGSVFFSSSRHTAAAFCNKWLLQHSHTKTMAKILIIHIFCICNDFK